MIYPIYVRGHGKNGFRRRPSNYQYPKSKLPVLMRVFRTKGSRKGYYYGIIETHVYIGELFKNLILV